MSNILKKENILMKFTCFVHSRLELRYANCMFWRLQTVTWMYLQQLFLKYFYCIRWWNREAPAKKQILRAVIQKFIRILLPNWNHRLNSKKILPLCSITFESILCTRFNHTILLQSNSIFAHIMTQRIMMTLQHCIQYTNDSVHSVRSYLLCRNRRFVAFSWLLLHILYQGK